MRRLFAMKELYLLLSSVFWLAAGGFAWLVDADLPAQVLRTLGTIEGLALSVAWIVGAVRRRQLTVDVIALLALAGQFLLGLLAGPHRDSNFFYRILQVVTNPVVRAVRFIAPRAVLDRHLPLASFVLLASIWLIVTMVKIDVCLRVGIDQCR